MAANVKDPNIAAYLKKYDHSKKKSAETLLAQIGEFHLQSAPYNIPFTSQINTALSWWKMCTPTPPYLQLFAINLQLNQQKKRESLMLISVQFFID